MVTTAVGGDFVEPLRRGCWCCGDQTVSASVVRLSAHPEVGVCFRCLGWLNGRMRAVKRATRRAPPGPWWRRVLYRAGFSRC
jgi:hypothetical protein